MTLDTDTLIIGGGLNGPALALALASAGLRSIVVDAMPAEVRQAPDFDGRSYALSLTTVRMLKALGVWARVSDHAQPILDIKVSDGRAGEGASPFFLHFDHREIEEGPMGHMLEDRYLRGALIEMTEASPLITVQAPARAISQQVDAAGVAVMLEDGRKLTASLLVGCDGRQSQTAMRAGISRSGHDYGQTGLVCAVEHEKPHHGIAHQFFMPPGPLAILPLPGNRSSLVWTETTERAREISAMDDADYMAELRPRFGDFLGEIRLVGARFSYPLNLTLANSFIGNRLALAGDAAHGVHPIAGQGLNLGLRDVAALAEVLVEAARRGEDIGSSVVLERYARWRNFDMATLVAATDTVNRLFSNDNPVLRLGRDLGLAVVNRIPALRQAFIREAAGLTGNLPRLMQGRTL